MSEDEFEKLAERLYGYSFKNEDEWDDRGVEFKELPENDKEGWRNEAKKLKAQILKEKNEDIEAYKERHMILLRQYDELKQNNQRNSVGVPFSKKENEHPLSALSDDELKETFLVHVSALEYLVSRINSVRWKVIKKSCNEIEEELKTRGLSTNEVSCIVLSKEEKPRRKQLSKESKGK